MSVLYTAVCRRNILLTRALSYAAVVVVDFGPDCSFHFPHDTTLLPTFLAANRSADILLLASLLHLLDALFVSFFTVLQINRIWCFAITQTRALTPDLCDPARISQKHAGQSAAPACTSGPRALKRSRCTCNSSYKGKAGKYNSPRCVSLLTAAISANVPAYILQLRDQIRPGASTSTLDDQHYLDLVAYWKERCEQLQKECNDLRTENNRLERSNHSLTKHTACVPDKSSDSVTNALKRKARGASPTRTARRRKGDQPIERSLAETQDDINDDMDFLDKLGQGESRSVSLQS